MKLVAMGVRVLSVARNLSTGVCVFMFSVSGVFETKQFVIPRAALVCST